MEEILADISEWQKIREDVQAEDMQKTAAKEREEAERKEAARKQEQAKRRAEIEASRPRSDESHPRSRPSSSKTARHHSTSPQRDQHDRSRSPKSIARAKPQGPNGGKPWTLEDIVKLTELHTKRSKKEMAEILGRTQSAVQNQLNRMFNPNYQHDDEDEGIPGTIAPKGDYNYADMAVVALYHLSEYKGYLTKICKLVERYFADDIDMRRLDGCANVPRYQAAMSTALIGVTTKELTKRDIRFERLNEKKGQEYYFKLTGYGIKFMETSPKFRRFLAPLSKEEGDGQNSNDGVDGVEEEEKKEDEMMVVDE